jgi:putative ABC transport system substrate-binding protein
MRRRAVIGGLAGLAAVTSAGALLASRSADLPAVSHKPQRVNKVVFLFTQLAEPVVQANMAITRGTLRELGHVYPQNIAYDERGAAGDTKRFAALAPEVVGLQPDVIVCQNVLAALALMSATKTIPIVFAAINADPVEAGVVASLARPGGNVTGIGIANSAIHAKRMQLLKELAPKVARVAVIEDRGAVPHSVNQMRAAAPALAVEVLPIYIGSVNDLDTALNSAVEVRADALINLAGFVTGTQTSAPKIANFALQRGWPTIGIAAELGGLLNYNGVLVEPWKRAGVYVDRILKGADPAMMPVEGPTGSVLTLNMCVAEKLGLTVPPSILSAATSLIQCG